jgi:hypothetical protein
MLTRDPWTITLAIAVSISATYIGFRNLEWALNATGLIRTTPSNSHHRTHVN